VGSYNEYWLVGSDAVWWGVKTGIARVWWQIIHMIPRETHAGGVGIQIHVYLTTEISFLI